jgi:protein required for attachment to host cells
MIHLFILTAVLSSVITIAAPHTVVFIRQYKTHKQRKLTSLIAAEVAKQLKDIIND